MRPSLLAVASAAAMLLSVGCSLILDIDEPIPKGGAGAGGTGGACDVASCPDPATACQTAVCDSDGTCGTSNASAGTDCSADGKANGKVCDGAGKCVQCNDAATDCPATGNDCIAATCDANVCGTMNVPDNAATPTGQTPGDCKKQVCVGGATTIVDDDADPGTDNNGCTTDTCSAGMNVHTNVASGTACSDGGGKVCGSGTKAGTCVGCLVNGDCTDPNNPTCDTQNDHFVCVPDFCSSGVKDGDESDTDCGGSCGGCLNGKACLQAADCDSGLCNALVCAACTVDGNCPANQFCNTQNGTCTDDKPIGQACGGSSHCVGNMNCVDGFCCDSACAGLCNACSAAKKGQGTDGACGPNAGGTDNDAECSTDAVSTCDQNGSCNGAGACQLYAAATVCGAASCSGNNAIGTNTCNGTGTCVVPAGVDCSPYVCAAGVCPATCTIDAQCTSANFCNGTTCVPKKANGQACTGTGSQCTSGNCIDSVRCDLACAGLCQGCTAAIKGQGIDGTCGSILVGTDPGNECALDAVATCDQNGFCNGAGACQLYPAATQCAAATCSGNNAVGASSCNGTGTCVPPAGVDCTPYVCAVGVCPSTCTIDVQCTSGFFCNGTNCIAKLAVGVSCGGNNECSNAQCSDGVCCSSVSCTACKACNIAGSLGTCTNITPPLTDDTSAPNTCTGNNTCTSGNCLLKSGQLCSLPAECASGVCTGGPPGTCN